MEITFLSNGKLYRIDGCEPKDGTVFWAEELNASFEGTDNYETFKLEELLEAQKQSVIAALTNTVYLEYLPQTQRTKTRAQLERFLAALKQENLPSPDEIAEENDLHISMEWYRSPRHIVSVSINDQGFLYWAALFGSESFKGSEPLEDKVPSQVISLIYRFVGVPYD